MSLIALLGFRVRGRMVACGVVCAITLGLLAAASSFAPERELEDAPPPTSIEEIEGPLERSYPEPEVRPSLFPWIRRQVAPLPPFLADSELYLRYRTYYLRQDRVNDLLSEAWAMEGSLYYRSGWLKELTATSVLMSPIVLTAAAGLGVAPHPLMMGIAVAASTAFLTPIGTTTNLMVFGPATGGEGFAVDSPLRQVVRDSGESVPGARSDGEFPAIPRGFG